MRGLALATLPLVFAAHNSAAASSNYDLNSLYQAAAARSESLSSARATLGQSEENYTQTIGALMPTLSGSASYYLQQDNGSGSSSYPTAKISLSQPLFRGLREFAALKQARLLEEASQALLKEEERALYVESAARYHAALAAEQELRNLDAQIQVIEKRVGELKQRVSVGRSRPADMLATEAQLASLRAERMAANGRVSTARESLSLLTGLPANIALAPISNRLPALHPLEKHLAALDAQPSVRAATRKAEAAAAEADWAWGGHLPSVDVAANYYLKRSSSYAGVNWDVTGTVSIPIFAGGITQSQVRVSHAKREAAQAAAILARRVCEENLRALFNSAQAGTQQVQELERAKDLFERSYRQQEKDYRLSLVSNIEALQALLQYQQAERSLDKARFDLRQTLTALGTYVNF